MIKFEFSNALITYSQVWQERKVNLRGFNLSSDTTESINDILKMAFKEFNKPGQIKYSDQKIYYLLRGIGLYGMGDMAGNPVLNLQELIQPMYERRYEPRTVEGLYVNKVLMTDTSASFNLGSTALMHPYAKSLPAAPIAKYLREGWRADNLSMKPRPTGTAMAAHPVVRELFKLCVMLIFQDTLKTKYSEGDWPSLKTTVR